MGILTRILLQTPSILLYRILGSSFSSSSSSSSSLDNNNTPPKSLDILSAALVITLRKLYQEKPENFIKSMHYAGIDDAKFAQSKLGVHLIKVNEKLGTNDQLSDSNDGAITSTQNEIKGHWILQNPNDLNNKEDIDNTVVLLNIHGGGYFGGSSLNGSSFLANIVTHFNKHNHPKNKKLLVFSVDYPLAPQHVYPVALNYVLDCYKWLTINMGFKSVYISGDSAGGHCAIYLLEKIHAASNSSLLVQPKGLLLYSPWVDLVLNNPPSNHFDYINPDSLKIGGSIFAGDVDPTDPAVSPIYINDPKFIDILKNTPILVSYGAKEIFYEGIETFIEKISNPQLKVIAAEDMCHDFQ